MIELFLILLLLSSVFSIQLSKNTINSYNLTYTSSIRVGEPQKEIKLDEYLCSYGLEKLLITLGQDYSHIIRHEKIGEGSVDKRAIWAVQISRNVQFKRKLLKPMIKLVANINGDETVGYGLMVSLIQYLVYSDGVDERITQMLNTTDIWIVPTLNPDRLFALENRTSQILYPTKYSSNGRGVELDQDFPDAFVEETWPYQEETESMLKFIKQNPFVLSANLQGGAIVASYPFDNNPDRSTLPGVLSLTPDNEMFEKLAKDYAQRNRMMAHGNECGKSFPDGISNGNYWNKKLGSMQDANYLLSNCFEITLHLSCCKWVPPFDLPKYWAANLPSMLNFIESVHQGIFGLVKDKEDNPIKGAFVKVKGRNKYIRTTEDGEYWMLLVPGSYNVTVRAPPTFIEETKLVVLTENKTHVQLDFHLTRQSVYGTVVNKENRNLVKGAIIKAFQREENKYVGNGIDIKVHDGQFGFKLSAGMYEMTVVAPGYCNNTKAVIVAEQEPVKVDFSLIHQGVYGTVRDANGNPVEGAVIKVLLQSERPNDNSQYPIDPWISYGSRIFRLVTKELTDEHGEYFFNPNLKQGNLIWATAAGFDEKFLGLNLDVMGTSVRKDFNLTLHVRWLSNYAVYGTLRDKKNRIIKGSVVRIYIIGSVVGEKGKEIVVKPNAEGWYSRPLFIGNYEITAMAPGYKDQKRKVTIYASDIQTPGTGCPPPELSLNQTRVLARRNSTPDFRTFSEVKFTAQFPGPGFTHYTRLCKIKCIDQRWIGPLCQGEDSEGKYEPILHGCRLGVIPSHLVVTYNNVTLHRVNETIPHNGEIKLRCQEPLGLYKLLGEAAIRCDNGKWAADLPLCIPTTSITNFTVESPPTILVRIPSGTAAVDEDTLIVFPGSILHLECLYLRSSGNPQWTWTSAFRQYLTGWAIASEEREWKYRLSIYYVKLLDSGTFTCTTPRGLSNSVHVNVKGVHCERLTLRSHERLTTKIDGHRLGQMAHFTCPGGTIREGPANITCMANGQWSDAVPTCQQIICPKLAVENPYLTLVEQNNTYGGHALFQCSWGYQLRGPADIVCQRNGSWSGPVPECNAVHCPAPNLPLNGHLIEDPTGGPYRVGAILQFACNDRHHLLGEETIVCTERGEWSRAPPRCKARCDYPGEPPNGKIIPLKFFYDPGDHIQVTCNDGYVKPLDISPPGTSGPYCQSDGTWSLRIPHCTNYTDV